MGFSHFWNVKLPWDEHQWRSSYQAWCSLTPKVQPSVSACCCTPPHHTYMSQYSYLHTTDMHTCLLTVMVISREQQANVRQWINTSLTPDPPHRQCIWGHNFFFFPSTLFLLTFRRSATSPPPPCCLFIQKYTTLQTESYSSSSTFKTFLSTL